MIMPGETKTISLPMKRQADGSFWGEWKEGDPDPTVESQGVQGWSFQQVPPPVAAPIQNRAQELGLCDGLRVKLSRHGGWRCSECRQMQRDRAEQVWVPAGVLAHDPAWSVTETCRRNTYNGHFSAWCLPCARRLGGGVLGINKLLSIGKSETGGATETGNSFPLMFGAAMGLIGLWVLLVTVAK